MRQSGAVCTRAKRADANWWPLGPPSPPQRMHPSPTQETRMHWTPSKTAPPRTNLSGKQREVLVLEDIPVSKHRLDVGLGLRRQLCGHTGDRLVNNITPDLNEMTLLLPNKRPSQSPARSGHCPCPRTCHEGARDPGDRNGGLNRPYLNGNDFTTMPRHPLGRW